METMQKLEKDAAIRTFAPLVNKRGSLEQLWAHLFKAQEADRVQTPLGPAMPAEKTTEQKS
jgi:hypothetical protein